MAGSTDVSSAKGGVAITPANTAIPATRALWVGGAGNLDVVFADQTGTTAVTLSAVPAGTLIPISAVMVKTSTTATLIVALY